MISGRDETGAPGSIRTVTPHLPASVMVKLAAFIEVKLEEEPAGLVKALRRLQEDWKGEPWSLELRTTALVIADLLDQGWSVVPRGGDLRLSPPGLRVPGESSHEAKERLRRSLRLGRDRQLGDKAVMHFLDRMSRPVRRALGTASVLDLVDRGDDLALALRQLGTLGDDGARATLRRLVDPVVEVCDEGARCAVTGIRLLDVWRYFRHTWSLEWRSIPGRQVPLLVRNAARPGRPVIGIALLASPVLRTKPRDEWVGWTTESLLARLRAGVWEPRTAVRALADRIEASLGEVRWDDLVHLDELADPSDRVVLRLEQRGAGAAAARARTLQERYTEATEAEVAVKSLRGPARGGALDLDWRTASEDLLFVRKRAETLAKLLAAKRTFRMLDWSRSGPDLLAQLDTLRDGNRAVSIALQEVRKAALSSQVADLSVCGAVAPYNELLGGKLVALLAASADVRDAWRSRYSEQVSIISSQMAGRAVRRPTDLKILTTTSLYGTGSSQYNRLRLRAADHPGLGQDLIWHELDRTAGYGTAHLNPTTVRVLRELSERQYGARRVNNRFGEGTSPRLRQVREGLEALGIRSDDVLHHATPRLFYACALARDAREQLLGLVPSTEGEAPGLASIAEAWRARWLLGRVRRPDVLDRLGRLGPATVRHDLLPVDVAGQYLMPFAE